MLFQQPLCPHVNYNCADNSLGTSPCCYLLPQLLQGPTHCYNFICHLCADKTWVLPCTPTCCKGEMFPFLRSALRALCLGRFLQAGCPPEEVCGEGLSPKTLRNRIVHMTKPLGFILSTSFCSEWKIHMGKQSSSCAFTELRMAPPPPLQIPQNTW